LSINNLQRLGVGQSSTPIHIALTKAFMRIKEPTVRRHIVKLVRQIAGDDD